MLLPRLASLGLCTVSVAILILLLGVPFWLAEIGVVASFIGAFLGFCGFVVSFGILPAEAGTFCLKRNFLGSILKRTLLGRNVDGVDFCYTTFTFFMVLVGVLVGLIVVSTVGGLLYLFITNWNTALQTAAENWRIFALIGGGLGGIPLFAYCVDRYTPLWVKRGIYTLILLAVFTGATLAADKPSLHVVYKMLGGVAGLLIWFGIPLCAIVVFKHIGHRHYRRICPVMRENSQHDS